MKSGMMFISALLIIFNSVFPVVPVFADYGTQQECEDAGWYWDNGICIPYVAEIGDTPYTSLSEAIAV
jgi:hypothetical protein